MTVHVYLSVDQQKIGFVFADPLITPRGATSGADCNQNDKVPLTADLCSLLSQVLIFQVYHRSNGDPFGNY